VRGIRIWARLLGVESAIVEDVSFEADEGTREVGVLVVSARPLRRDTRRCGLCRKRSPLYDKGEGRRRWRALDLGTVQAYVEAEAPRVECRKHGVGVAWIPWARHDARYTREFEDTAAWMATHTSKTTLVDLFRVTWRTVGRIITRVMDEGQGKVDRFAGLTRIGIDEISYKKGHRYITVVVNHDTGRLIWAAPGRDKDTLGTFFDELGEERCAAITLVSADAADWISTVVGERCKNATLCMDPFHVVQWATKALDEVRRQVWNVARKSGQKEAADDLKGARYALWKNPEDLTKNQRAKLSVIQDTNRRLYRAYLLKEQLRKVFRLRGKRGMNLLDAWLTWARRCQIPEFVKVAKSISNHRAAIEAALTEGLTNARVESMNTKIRLITRMAFGFRSTDALIALAMLSLGGLCPSLPGRA